MNSARNLGGRLRKEVASVFVCDVQERFRDVIHGMPCVIDTTSRMVRTANALNMPVITTEQYPKGLGKTVEELQAIIDPKYVFEKTKFSMWTKEVEEAYNKQFDLYGSGASGLGQVLLCGIETHVCIFQTALDLLERGVEVHVVVDGVSSQRSGDRSVAVQRLAQAGAWLCTSETAESMQPALGVVAVVLGG